MGLYHCSLVLAAESVITTGPAQGAVCDCRLDGPATRLAIFNSIGTSLPKSHAPTMSPKRMNVRGERRYHGRLGPLGGLDRAMGRDEVPLAKQLHPEPDFVVN